MIKEPVPIVSVLMLSQTLFVLFDHQLKVELSKSFKTVRFHRDIKNRKVGFFSQSFNNYKQYLTQPPSGSSLNPFFVPSALSHSFPCHSVTPLQRYCQSTECQRGWHEDLWGLCELLGLDPYVRRPLLIFMFSVVCGSWCSHQITSVDRPKSMFKVQTRVPSMHVFVFLQWSGDYHGGQSTLYPAAALHCWCAPVAPYLWCHRCHWLWWECTPHGQRPLYISRRCHPFFFKIPVAVKSFVTTTWARVGFVSPCGICFLASFLAPCLSGIWHCYWEYRTLSGKPGANVTISDIGFHTDFSIYLQLSQTWLIFSELLPTSMPLLHTSVFKC